LAGLLGRIFRSFPLNESHSVIVPGATYAPWLADAAFLSVYKVIRKNTLVDIYRCYELWQLTLHTRHLVGNILEVGVWRGGTGCLLASAAPESIVYLCDTFKGVPKASVADSSYRGGEHCTPETYVKDLLKNLDLHNAAILKGVFPEETGNQCASDTFRLVHIDVDVYQSAKDVLSWAWPRVCTGGVVIFDDYGFSSCDGVTQLVNEQRHQQDRVTLHNLNGHAILVKLDSSFSGR
jgi:O-methyltransferase